MPSIEDLLPPAKGYLPYFMLLLSVVSIGNSFQNLATLHYTRRVYNGRFVRNPALPARSAGFEPEDSTNKLVPAGPKDNDKAIDQTTPLAARLFGTWTLLASIVRCYAAYYLHLAPVYQIVRWTYAIAGVHFVSELLWFRSMTLGVPQMFPLVLATVGTVWMTLAYDFYVEI